MWTAVIRLVRQGFPCLFHLLTGLYCPGCGGTRAFRFFLRGQWRKSFCYNPIILYAALVTLIQGICWMVSKGLKKPDLYPLRPSLFLYIGAAIILINWIYKNYMLIVCGIDLLP
ncbi:DUF2752 domain-containing protein [Lachnospiraceae bacterium 62-35]